ncbi:MAG: DUF4837 family protein [Saprospiraceae bacterium]|nr:MAG: DUF4837 family protein [Saprospiraceae bacterium]
MKQLQLLGILFLFFYACSSDTAPGKISSTNNAHGKVNQILVIADSALWAGPAGDTFYYYFGGPYLLLPQPEPIFDIKHLTPEQLAKQRAQKEFRTILFLADVRDNNSSTAALVRQDVGEKKIARIPKDKGYSTIVGKDKWARGQLLFYVFAEGEDKLMENVVKNFPPIARRINEADEEVVKATTYQAGENAALEADVKLTFGADIKVPGDFRKAMLNTKTNTMWLRREVRDANANILIHKRPYTNKAQLTKEGLKTIRNEVSKIVTSNQPNSFMQINDVDLPMLVENKMVNNRYTLQARGIWDMANDFKGGPFLSCLMLNPDDGYLLLVDAFVFAPGEDKRNYMQELELILDSTSF